ELSPQYGVSGDGRTPGKKQARDVLTLRVQSLLKAVQALVFGESAEPLGVPPQSEWRGTAEGRLGSFERWVEAPRLSPCLGKYFPVAWYTEACFVLANDAGKENAARWAAVIAWAAVRALGELLSPSEPDHAGAKLFDALRLREPIGNALSRSGLTGDEHWRA